MGCSGGLQIPGLSVQEPSCKSMDLSASLFQVWFLSYLFLGQTASLPAASLAAESFYFFADPVKDCLFSFVMGLVVHKVEPGKVTI